MSEPQAEPAHLQKYAERIRALFVREPRNPIIRPEDVPMPCKAVCNPGAVEFEGEVLLLLRVIDPNDRSSLVVARSKDGIGDWRIEREALLAPQEWFDDWGCEDARITYLADREEYVIAYAGYSRFGAGVCLATTKDFRTATRLGMVIHPYNKDAVLFPEKIAGRYRMLHRPTMAPLEDVWISESEDLLHWGAPRCVLHESDRPGWQGGKVGAGPPPFRVDDGWALIYHGVERSESHWTYRAGMALRDGDVPERLMSRWPEWVFAPEESYEHTEDGQGIVFPTGIVRRDGHQFMYYGAGDRFVGLVVTDLEKLQRFREDFRREFHPRTEATAAFYANRPGERA